MAKITSKAQLNVGVELTVNEPAKTFTLNAAGNLVAKDGVTIQALYSKFVDLWATATYQDSPFPMYAIDALSGQFQFGTDGSTFSGWKPADDTTRQMLRDGGWNEYSGAGALNRVYAGVTGLGEVSAGAQLYYIRAAVDAPTNFTFDDQCNEGIQVFGDASNGNFDKRTFFRAFVREGGKSFKDSVLADTGKTATGAYIVNMLLSNADDLKITDLDGALGSAPYDGITASFYSVNQARVISGVSRNFKIIVDADGATLEQVHTKLQYLLRQATDINDSGTAGSVIGKTASSFGAFAGDEYTTATSVFFDNISPADSNRIVFTDDGGVARTNPYTAAGVITANAPLIGAGSSYRLLYTAPAGAGNDYGESGAITVVDADSNPITGVISSGSIPFTFDYDGDTAGGTAGTDKDVTLVGIKPGTGKFVVATGTLTRSKSIVLSLVAEQDRVYA